ncbi:MULTISPECIES: GTPase Era [Roseivirga]|jgi:GTP-binding protein Era|uniref:GTPase Era n=1 Tax=Roseivirga spongicola TaxID=333140 RepID=A0A150XFQ0_9BACT|nr:MULTISPECIES: GTPase Era [Roseivirga]KYG77541.1 GTPase Era [Roseivirga spongicola]MBO6495554.1 GTPase Era [Roseivirga sp.]MBO6661662.1 GTPase Era [Roseivirga sp.]MBO6760971.1 GTPase Era [Roseivirga sp.]MBO6908353.1 GTPase Era [Roseivirga sp.]
MSEKSHKAGFISIIGKPNVGKSTLMNALVGERLSIITSKAQTTRHRIMGILSGENFQVIYSDTPGILKPEYKLHETMMSFVNSSFEDADVLLFVTDLYEKYDGEKQLDFLKDIKIPTILVMNKVDLAKGSQAEDKIAYWKEMFDFDAEIMVSALEKLNIQELFSKIIDLLPEHEAYFPKDELTDKPERFFVNEIIREKIFLNYKKEIPYSCEVVTHTFKEDEKIIRIMSDIYVERKSQKGIVIGHRGEAIKKVGIQAREELEKFFGKQVHLETFVKVEQDWRKKELKLKGFGYSN